MSSLAKSLIRLVHSVINALEQAFLHLTLPCRHSLVLTIALDVTRPRAELIAENALLRQQLIILNRQVKKPRFTQAGRLWLVLLVSRVRSWKATLLILKPDTLLRWHRQGFRLFWKLKSRFRGRRPGVASETIALIQQMAKENRLWGAERIHGELIKLGIQVAKATIQKYPGPPVQGRRPFSSPTPRPKSELVNFHQESRPPDLGL